MMVLRSAVPALATAVVLIFLAVSVTANAQQTPKVWRIGLLSAGDTSSPRFDALREGLRDLGYVEGRNIAIEHRGAAGSREVLPALAADLVTLKVDVIVAVTNPAITAAQQATKTIPIVMLTPTDAVDLGFVASLSRPGGNITGMTTQTAEDLAAKRVQFLKEAAPYVRRIAVLWDPTDPSRRQTVDETERAARKLLLDVRS